ncbi:MAG: Gfo/Idh/MocA family oxidoreductase [Verrucomicrobia bacterium]|nr:Gfo/Idh/MocA family oxidoreductase [Verrucomicrobiota bacterium]
MNRRTFLVTASTAFIATQLFPAHHRPRRVAVIGHTGRGNYGHGLDVVWQQIPGVEIVGVADPDEQGLKKALTRLKIEHGFSDYRKMLKELRPEFVSVAPRHPDQHLEMALAAIQAGVKGLYIEKPFCRTPAEADRLIEVANKQGAKIAVAHRNRYHPVLPIVAKLIEEKEIGRLLEIQGYGKGDRRGGGEDLWVLGGHVCNLFQFFGGEPKSCSAIVLQNGKPVTRNDVVEGAEGLGLIAGNEIHARWHLSSGLTCSYKTFANDGSNSTGYAAHLIGTKGTITIKIDGDPFAWLSPGNAADPVSRNNARIPITTAGLGKKETQHEKIASVHNHVLPVRDLIDAVDHDRAPLCDARQGSMAVEMICSVFESHRQNGALVSFPLAERGNPLSKF